MDEQTARRLLGEEMRRLTQTRSAAARLGEGAVQAERTELSTADQHPADAASELAERETQEALARTVEADLMRVEAALARLERGAFGSCEVCGRPIEDERLEVTPTARTCIEHREQEAALAPPPARAPEH